MLIAERRADRSVSDCEARNVRHAHRSCADVSGTRAARERNHEGGHQITTKRIILDTDPGIGTPGADIDDGLAIILALHSPELKVEAITTVNGNVDVDVGTANALRLLDVVGAPAVPVARGSDRPLRGSMRSIRDAFSRALGNGEQAAGVGPTARKVHDRHAVDLVVDLVRSNPGEITFVAIGPLTNLAAAIHRDPSVSRDLASVVIMGGAATVLAQNMTTVAEFNMYVDPVAANVVLRSGATIDIVGLDVTMQVFLTKTDVDRLKMQPTALAMWIADRALPWIDFLGRAFPDRPEYRDGCALHDPLALAALIDPGLVTFEPAVVAVEERSRLTRGQMVADRGLAIMRPSTAPNARVATAVDVAGFKDLFLSRLTSPAGGPRAPLNHSPNEGCR